MLLLTAVLLAAAPAKAAAAPPPISAPLGNISEALTPVPEGGHPLDNPWFARRLAGCDHDQAVYPLRYVSGVMDAVRTLDAWLRTSPKQERRLFGKGHLFELVARVEKSALAPGKACEALGPFPLAVAKAPKLCEGQADGEHWLLDGAAPTAVVRVGDAGQGARDVCLPQVSVVLFDAKGKARLRYQADYAQALSVTVEGDGCQALDFTFDKATQRFTPSPRVVKGCTP
ncbi:MAG: hypothetical protein K1X89_27010 [Myxococcaceae bacterium]|nr:hypothetical protein [Myxococcaceae bacterium]